MHTQRHSGLQSLKTLQPFAITTAALSRAFRKDDFLFKGEGPFMFLHVGFGTALICQTGELRWNLPS